MILDINDLQKQKQIKLFIEKSKYSNILQTKQWANVKTNWDHHIFYREKQGEIIASLSVISAQNQKCNKKLFYAPRGPVCDIKDIESVKYLLEEASQFAKENNGFVLILDPEIEYNQSIIDLYKKEGIEFHRDKKAIQPPINAILDINGRSFDEIRAKFPKTTRRLVNKSYKEDFEIHEASREDMPRFYELVSKMSANKEIGHRTLDYFYSLYDQFHEQSRITFVKYNDELIACSWMIIHNNKAFAIYGADPILYRLNQSYFLNAEEIRYCCENNIKEYDMGGLYSTDINDGLYNFKRKFTEDRMIEWIGEIRIVLDEDTYEKFKQNK